MTLKCLSGVNLEKHRRIKKERGRIKKKKKEQKETHYDKEQTETVTEMPRS